MILYLAIIAIAVAILTTVVSLASGEGFLLVLGFTGLAVVVVVAIDGLTATVSRLLPQKCANHEKKIFAVSAKEKLGIEGLKREIVKQFANEFLFCTLYIPYADTEKYAKEKRLLVERRVEYLDDGQLVHATIPRRYADTFTPYLKEIQQEK